MTTPLHETAHLHETVLLEEAVTALAPVDGGIYVDGTFGRGGHSRALLRAASCRVIAIDRDPEAILSGAALAAEIPDRFTLIEGRLGDLSALLAERGLTERGIPSVSGVLFDLGTSSPQFDDPERGFSFRGDGPLDMRMGGEGASAADLVNTLSEAKLAQIIYLYGEERFSRRVARAILAARAKGPITRTGHLAAVVRGVVPNTGGIDPATRTFQALRISVNDELGELVRGLHAAEAVLAPGGRLAVIAFHSLEDRLVKDFLRRRSGGTGQVSRHIPLPLVPDTKAPSFRLLTRKPVLPGEAELARNPRARSARMRVAERTAAPAFPPDPFEEELAA